MIDLKQISRIYFIGIGGIGMSALARYFFTQGKQVSGYDRTPTPLTRELEASGMPVHYTDSPELAPRDAELVVYTPAIPATHAELNYYRDHKYTVLKRSDVLELISRTAFNICVAGTHGKTTITTMVAHLLRHSGYGCNAFLGGISANYGTNFWSHERNLCVIEADEYDRSFLKLFPDIAIISSMDADHLDIYGTEAEMQNAFIAFSAQVKPGGLLLSKFGLSRGGELKAPNHITYSLQNESAGVYGQNIQLRDGAYTFSVVQGDWTLEGIELNMGGMHNVENVIAAIAVARHLGIADEKIKAAVAAFAGVKRRFEYMIKNRKLVLVDDYAHHPEELRALISGAKTLFRERKCTVIFQPHLFTRTRDLADGFAASLDLADEVILLPIYPARELPIDGVSSEMILERMKLEYKKVVQKEDLLPQIQSAYIPAINAEFGNLLIMAGAGDIDALVGPVKQLLMEQE